MRGAKTIKKINEGVRTYFGINMYDFYISDSRDPEILYAKQVAMYLARVQEIPLKLISKEFNRHYSTIISSAKKIAGEVKVYKERKEEVEYLKKTLRVRNAS